MASRAPTDFLARYQSPVGAEHRAYVLRRKLGSRAFRGDLPHGFQAYSPRAIANQGSPDASLATFLQLVIADLAQAAGQPV